MEGGYMIEKAAVPTHLMFFGLETLKPGPAPGKFWATERNKMSCDSSDGTFD